ncbi:hypothetical protein DN402_24600 [Streptomyces sp. SW4]|nr:hypothetical protein DN402_24600 [Streptomyces sp. SW4]
MKHRRVAATHNTGRRPALPPRATPRPHSLPPSGARHGCRRHPARSDCRHRHEGLGPARHPPEEPHNLDRFRRHFHGKRFWCGTLLGGCGGELMTKRYETKVCHFAHYPDHTGTAPVCHRVANGADSADHLFIKRDLTAWLKAQGIRVQAELRNLGTSPGDAVDLWLPKTRQRMRFQLCPRTTAPGTGPNKNSAHRLNRWTGSSAPKGPSPPTWCNGRATHSA